jgi:hypothetical protein
MRRQAYNLITVLAVLGFMTLSAKAQSTTCALLSADIPFDFIVGNRTLPAGTYSVKCVNATTDRKAFRFASKDGRESVLIQTNLISANTSHDGAKLVFHRYGDHYFFAQIWVGDNDPGFEAPKTRTQKRMAQDVAANPQKIERVALNK